MTEGRDSPGDHEQLEPGARVEVWDRFTNDWTNGFTVEEAAGSGYRLRRHSDQRVLPAQFPAEHVRRERRSMWWF